MYKLKMFIAITAFVAVGSLLVLLHFSSAWRIPTVRSQRRANRGEGSSGTAVLIVPSETTASHHSDIASFNNSEKTIDDFIVSALNEQSDPTTASPLDGESALATPESTRETNGIMSGKKEGLLEVCPDVRSSLVGRLAVNSVLTKMEDLNREFSAEFGGWVLKGGTWRPRECKARIKMALIIPFRNRYEQLSIFVRHMHPMLKRQKLDYRIVVVEQAGNTPFNRAMLFNVGYKEALKLDDYQCFIFHDVDLIPEDDRNMYSCPTSPRHMSVAVDKFNYVLPYSTIFGGAGAFLKKDFENINGFSNEFWGWGGEDDDLYKRIVAKHYKLTRPSIAIGRYSMIKIHHKQSSRADPERFSKLTNSVGRMGRDGINSLKYNLIEVVEAPLYTMAKVHIDRSMTNS